MAEYGACGESEYTMVTFADLFDLRYARIFKAVIVSIDAVAKTAEITIEEQCPDLEGKDLSSVPFFYHCEDSTGTVEDLENGYKAFAAQDEVFVLLVPANKETAERFFIIGHFNIRTNKKCTLNEYLIVSMSSAPTYVTMFDVGAGRVIDLVEFANLDESSPPKPAAFPCIATQEVTDWFNYNFRSSIPACTVPGYGSAYTDAGTIVYSDSGPSSDGLSKCTRTETIGDSLHSTKVSLQVFEQRIYGVDPKYTWQHVNIETDMGYTASHEIHRGEDTDGWKFFDDIVGDFYYFLIWTSTGEEIVEEDITRDQYNSTIANEVTADRSWSNSFSIKLHDSPERLIKTSSGSLHAEADMWDVTSVSLSGELGFNENPTKWSVIKTVGEHGTYVATGLSLTSRVPSSNPDHYYYSNTYPYLDQLCDQCISFAELGPDIYEHTFLPISTVAKYADVDGLDMSVDVSLRLLMENRSATVSEKLDEAVLELVGMVYAAKGWDAAKNGITSVEAVMRKKL